MCKVRKFWKTEFSFLYIFMCVFRCRISFYYKKIIIFRHLFAGSWFFVLCPLLSFNLYCVFNNLKNIRNFNSHLLYIDKEFSRCLWRRLFISIRWKCCKYLTKSYIISIGRKAFPVVDMMMWSSIEMKTKFLQNFKTISPRKFFKILRLVSSAIILLTLNKKLRFWILCTCFQNIAWICSAYF